MLTQRTQAIGWYGVVAILTAYALANFSVLTTQSVIYQLLNLTGAAALIIETAKKRDMQPLVLNIVWALVAVIALIQLFI